MAQHNNPNVVSLVAQLAKQGASRSASLTDQPVRQRTDDPTLRAFARLASAQVDCNMDIRKACGVSTCLTLLPETLEGIEMTPAVSGDGVVYVITVPLSLRRGALRKRTEPAMVDEALGMAGLLLSASRMAIDVFKMAYPALNASEDLRLAFEIRPNDAELAPGC